jgi:hypothetical protein
LPEPFCTQEECTYIGCQHAGLSKVRVRFELADSSKVRFPLVRTHPARAESVILVEAFFPYLLSVSKQKIDTYNDKNSEKNKKKPFHPTKDIRYFSDKSIIYYLMYYHIRHKQKLGTE